LREADISCGKQLCACSFRINLLSLVQRIIVMCSERETAECTSHSLPSSNLWCTPATCGRCSRLSCSASLLVLRVRAHPRLPFFIMQHVPMIVKCSTTVRMWQHSMLAAGEYNFTLMLEQNMYVENCANFAGMSSKLQGQDCLLVQEALSEQQKVSHIWCNPFSSCPLQNLPNIRIRLTTESLNCCIAHCCSNDFDPSSRFA
jgi:hypothetical protein